MRNRELHIASLIRGATDILKARSIHAGIIEDASLQNSRYILNFLIEAYGRLGSFGDARLSFNCIASPNLHSWNILLAASTRCNPLPHSWEIFQQMPARDSISWNTILSAAGDTSETAERIFQRMPAHGVVSSTSMMQANAQLRHQIKCTDLFHLVPHRSIFTWTVLLDCFCRSGELERARDAFGRMPEWNSISWTALFAAYASQGDILQANNMFMGMIERDDVAWIEFLQLHVNSGGSDEALMIFSLMPCHNIVAWNIWIAAGADDSEAVFGWMPERDLVSWNTLLMRLDSSKAKLAAEKMPQWNLVTWNMVLQLSQVDPAVTEALFFERIPEHDSFTWNIMMQCYTGLENSDAALRMFSRMPQHDPVSATLIVSSLGQAGRFTEAYEVVSFIPVLESTPWSALIEACSRAGELELAVELLWIMTLEGMMMGALEPAIASILAGFSHAGLVKEGGRMFRCIRGMCGVDPSLEHYCCMIDLLGRSEQLDDAKDLIVSMPLEPSVASWTSLLGACRTHGDVEGCANAAARILQMESQEDFAATYVLLSNVYS